MMNIKTQKRTGKEVKESGVLDYLNGMSYREVAVKYGVNHKVVMWWVKKSGNSSRSKKDAEKLMSIKTKGQRRSISTEFKKGLTPWNNNTKGTGIMKSNKTSFKKGDRISPSTEFKKGDIPFNWKGENVGYFSLHAWVSRHKGKAKVCHACGSTDNVQWANKSLEYKRDLEDWIELCCKCHRKYDRENGWGNAIRKYPELQKTTTLCLQDQ